MSVAITNLTSRPLLIALNSGASLRLSPGEVADKVPDVELKNNSKIDKLVGQRAIAVARPAGAPETEAETDEDTEKPRSRKRN